MAPMVNTDDLVDAQAVAEMLRLSSRNGISVYRRRYPDFPVPVINLGRGRPMLWMRSDIESWAAKRA